MKTAVVLAASIFAFVLAAALPAFATCTPGTDWTVSWTDQYGETTYTLTAPCKVYIGVPFNINATASDSYYPNSSVAYPWAIYDAYDPGTGLVNDTVAGGSWLTLSGGHWQTVVSRTYSGTPYDHTIGFYANDLGHGTGAHNFSQQIVGNVTVDPFLVDAGPDLVITASQQGSTVIHGTTAGTGLSYRWLEGATVLQGYLPVDGSGGAPLDLSTLSPLSDGAHTLTLQITDGNATNADAMVLTIGAPAAAYVGYDPKWFGITFLILMAAGAYLLRGRTARS